MSGNEVLSSNLRRHEKRRDALIQADGIGGNF